MLITKFNRRCVQHFIAIGFGVMFASSAIGADALYIDNNGFVGIGTSTPSETLHVFGESSPNFLKMRLEQNPSNAWAYSLTDLTPKGTVFRISKQGSGGPEFEVAERLDLSGYPTLEVFGSVKATNVIFSSSRKLKTDIKPLDGRDILARLSELSISQWRYKEDESGKVHFGPMAEDFTAAFDLDGPGETISVVDSNGVALAAVKGLVLELNERDRKIEGLVAQVKELKDAIDELRDRQ